MRHCILQNTHRIARARFQTRERTKLARERGVRYEEIVRRMGEIKRADLGSIVLSRAEGGGDAGNEELCVFSQEFCDEVDREYGRFKQELCEEHGLTWDQGNE